MAFPIEPAPVDPAALSPTKSVAPDQKPGGPPPPPGPKQLYGIDDAIRLMRTLPVDDNVDLVVRVIKKTLESLSVRVPDIIDDASKRQETLKGGISEHQAAIVQLEREIEARRNEISRLEDALAETTTVRERLQLAESLQNSMTPKAPATTSRAAPPLPTSFRPKVPQEPKKSAAPLERDNKDTPIKMNLEEADQPVESTDLIEKSP
jgi:hypothetical protein